MAVEQYLKRINIKNYEGFRCRSCHFPSTSNYNSLSQSNFNHIGHLKYGDLFACKHCDYPWYLEVGNLTRFIHSICLSKIDELIDWNNGATKIQSDIVFSLGKIDIHSLIPCEVITTDGKLHPLSLINFSHFPPISKNVYTGNKISTVKESVFEIPKSIRDAANKSIEVHNGFFPTAIITPTGKNIILNGVCYFYTGNECAAGDLKLLPEGYESIQGKDFSIYDENRSDLSVFVFDVIE
jgi:hypothetical protein